MFRIGNEGAAMGEPIVIFACAEIVDESGSGGSWLHIIASVMQAVQEVPDIRRFGRITHKVVSLALYIGRLSLDRESGRSAHNRKHTYVCSPIIRRAGLAIQF